MSFNKVKSFHDADQDCTVTEYLHDSGFRHIHLENTFHEMGFALSVPTPPEDDTGMPHILEHLTLSGSDKYPTKDPFMSMLNRSVAHDMNAMTSPMHTTYYFATTLEKDFENLSDLYLDLVFNPLLRKKDFEREGWRIEENNGNKELKGVVLNEMMGVYSNPDHFKYETLLERVFPDTPLSYSSGGHPLSIPFLNYDQLEAFHDKCYTPKKSVLVTCGKINIKKLHKEVDSTLLRKLEKKNSRDVDSENDKNQLSVKHKNAFKSFKQQGNKNIVPIPGDKEQSNEYMLIYKMDASDNFDENIYNSYLSQALFGNPLSPLRKLMEKWHKEISFQYVNLNQLTKNDKVAFLFSIEDITKEEQENFKKDIEQLWKDIKKQGCQENIWKSIILSQKSMIKNQEGTSLMNAVLGVSSEAVLGKNIEDPFNAIKRLERFSTLIPDNKRVSQWCDGWLKNGYEEVFFVPDENLISKWNQSQKNQIEEIFNNRNNNYNKIDDNKKNISIKSEDVLPSLDKSDLTAPKFKDIKPIKIKSTDEHCAYSLFNVMSPKVKIEILYDLGDLELSDKEKMVLNLYSTLGNKLGTVTNAKEQELWEKNYGLKSSFNLHNSLADLSDNPGIIFSYAVSALPEFNIPAIQSIANRTLNLPLLEEDHWKNIFSQKFNDLSSKFKSSDFQINQAKSEILKNFSKLSYKNNQLNTYFKENSLKWLKEAIKDPSKAHGDFKDVLSKVYQCPCHIVAVGKKENISHCVEQLSSVYKSNKAWNHLEDWKRLDIKIPLSQNNNKVNYFPTSTMNNYCFRGQIAPYKTDGDYAPLQVSLSLLRPKLYEVVREKGGAYGVSVSLNNSTMLYNSYRDPNIEKTLMAYDNSHNMMDLILNKKDDKQLLESKIALFKSFSKPLSESDIADLSISNLLTGNSMDKNRKSINKMINTTWEDIKAVNNKWLNPKVNDVVCSVVCDYSYIEDLNKSKKDKILSKSQIKKTHTIKM